MRIRGKQMKTWITEEAAQELCNATILANRDSNTLIEDLVKRYRVQMVEKMKVKPRIKPWGEFLEIQIITDTYLED